MTTRSHAGACATVRRLIVAAGACMALSAPAFAQLTETQENDEMVELHCVYDSLSEDDVLALARAYETGASELSEEAAESVALTSEGCGVMFGWSDAQRALADETAVASAVVDMMLLDLEDLGMADTMPLILLWDELPADVVETLVTGGWKSDAALAAQLRAAVVGAGVPDTDAATAKAMTMIEAASIGALASDDWLAMAQGDLDASADQ